MKRHQLASAILTFALLFFVGSISSLTLFKKLENVIKSSENWSDFTTTLPELLASVTELVNIGDDRGLFRE
jgi:hypothetical protein